MPATHNIMSTRRTYTKNEDLLIIKLVREKYTHKDIAKRLGRTRQGISHRVRLLGISRKKTHKQWGDGEIQTLKQLRKQNILSISEMAGILHRSFPSVGSMIRILGI